MGIVQAFTDYIRPDYTNNQNRILFCFTVCLVIILSIFEIWAYVVKIPLELALSVNAVVITLIIAVTQQVQLKKIEVIGMQTKETTEAFGTESIVRQTVEDFFKIKESKGENYELFFPVEYISKPLPLINQGDFYAIHVISTRLNEKRITNKPLRSSRHPDAPKEKNVIFICSPDANPALNEIYNVMHIVTIDNKRHIKTESCPTVPGQCQKSPEKCLIPHDIYKTLPNKLPCWFAREESADCKVDLSKQSSKEQNSKGKNRMIYVPETNDLIKSQVDSIYEISARDKNFIHPLGTQRDYGIFGRWHDKDHQFFIIAGIHQYGTWIIATLLNRLLCGNPIEGKEYFLGKEDFIAVIEGEFDYQTLKVGRIKIPSDFLWIKKKDKWERMGKIE